MTRVLVAGRSGQLARSLEAISLEDVTFVCLGRPELDLCDPRSIDSAIAAHRPALIINAAAYTAVDKAESDEAAAFAVNRDGAGALASAARAHGLPIVHVSTDYVFDGNQASPYEEGDPVAPAGVYGRSKLAGEQAVAAANPAYAILRTAWVYSPYGHNFLKTMLRLAADRDSVRVVADQTGTPTYAPDLAEAIAAVARRMMREPDGKDWRGIFHLVAEGDTSWAGFAAEIFSLSRDMGGPSALVEPITTADYPTPARRPQQSRLSTRRFHQTFGHILPPWQDGTRRCLATLAQADRG